MRQATRVDPDKAADQVAALARQSGVPSAPGFERPSATAQRQAIDALVADSPRTARLRAGQQAAHAAPVRQLAGTAETADAPAPPNRTGLPDTLKAGIEQLSGMSMDHVTVHYNSARPAQLQAHAYAQGSEIHVAPGQEHHLPHEAWHVVQQAQGRVPVTRQAKGMVGINDDAALEREADAMGARALQAGRAGRSPAPAAGGRVPGHVAQLALRLKIGISGSTTPLGITWDQIPADTYVWILTNQKAAPDALDGDKVKAGFNKTTVNDIIDTNFHAVNTPLARSTEQHRGVDVRGLYQSGIFRVPRAPGGGIDYSFLRYAAFASYRRWCSQNGARAWPLLDGGGVIIETIDADTSGITGVVTGTPKENRENGWLAQAGVYRWNLAPIKTDPRVIAAFSTRTPDDLNTRVDQFGAVYTAAEIEKRSAAAEANILRIYFPEPATRLSSHALGLLNQPRFGNMKVTRGQQLGFGRESIGMIAALVHLDPDGRDRAVKKLSFDPGFVVETDLGIRKDDYVTLFLNWNTRVDEGAAHDSKAVVAGLPGLAGFDQSYLNERVPEQVARWHEATINEMAKGDDKVAGAYFHPESN